MTESYLSLQFDVEERVPIKHGHCTVGRRRLFYSVKFVEAGHDFLAKTSALTGSLQSFPLVRSMHPQLQLAITFFGQKRQRVFAMHMQVPQAPPLPARCFFAILVYLSSTATNKGAGKSIPVVTICDIL